MFMVPRTTFSLKTLTPNCCTNLVTLSFLQATKLIFTKTLSGTLFGSAKIFQTTSSKSLSFSNIYETSICVNGLVDRSKNDLMVATSVVSVIANASPLLRSAVLNSFKYFSGFVAISSFFLSAFRFCKITSSSICFKASILIAFILGPNAFKASLDKYFILFSVITCAT